MLGNNSCNITLVVQNQSYSSQDVASLPKLMVFDLDGAYCLKCLDLASCEPAESFRGLLVSRNVS